MSNGYSRSPKILKGALISFDSPLLIPVPNLIVFQYNPETLNRTLSPWVPKETTGGTSADPSMAQPDDPEESVTLSLELDAADALEEPDTHPVAVISGVADRLAAIEMLMYPPDEDGGLLGSLNVSVSVSLDGSGVSAGGGAAAEAVPRKTVPIVLFFWGPGKIVPVRITTFSVEEQAFSPLLYPLRAKVSLGLKILDAADLALEDQESAVVKIAQAAYTFTRTQKQVLALANLANSVESIIGMLPF